MLCCYLWAGSLANLSSLFQLVLMGKFCIRVACCGALALSAVSWANTAVAAAPSNDSLANAIVLTGTNVFTNSSNVGASKQPGEPSHAGDAGGRSVWWAWTAPFTGSVIMNTSGSNFDTLLAV